MQENENKEEVVIVDGEPEEAVQTGEEVSAEPDSACDREEVVKEQETVGESAEEPVVTEEAEEPTVTEEATEEPAVTEEATEEPVVTEEAAEELAVAEENGESAVESMSAEVMKMLQAMDEKMEQMNQLFVRKIQHTAHEEKIVDQMHSELQKYKEDMYSQLVRPILLDIIEMRNSILRMSSNYASKPEGEQDIPLKTFSGYAFDIQDILEKNNITIYDSKEGDDYTPLKQRVIKKVPVAAEELHGKIAESLCSGYEYMGKTISPERVAVFIYEKPQETEETEETKGEN